MIDDCCRLSVEHMHIRRPVVASCASPAQFVITEAKSELQTAHAHGFEYQPGSPFEPASDAFHYAL